MNDVLEIVTIFGPVSVFDIPPEVLSAYFSGKKATLLEYNDFGSAIYRDELTPEGLIALSKIEAIAVAKNGKTTS